jgi:hypothetical protein
VIIPLSVRIFSHIFSSIGFLSADILKDVNPLRLGTIRLSATPLPADDLPYTYRRALTYLLKMLKVEYCDRYCLVNDKANKHAPGYTPPCLQPPAWMHGPTSIGTVFDAIECLKEQFRKFRMGLAPFNQPLRPNETILQYWQRLDQDPEAQPLAVSRR